MESVLVELKKVKLTKSIIGQIQQANFDEMVPENVLGWVLHDKRRKILIYDSLTKKLKYAHYPTKIEVKDEHYQINNEGTREQRYFIDYYTDKGCITFKDRSVYDLENVTKKCDRLEEFKNAVRVKGQLYY